MGRQELRSLSGGGPSLQGSVQGSVAFSSCPVPPPCRWGMHSQLLVAFWRPSGWTPSLPSSFLPSNQGGGTSWQLDPSTDASSYVNHRERHLSHKYKAEVLPPCPDSPYSPQVTV